LDATYDDYEKLLKGGKFEKVHSLNVSLFRPLSLNNQCEGRMPCGIMPRSLYIKFLSYGGADMFTKENRADGKLAEKINKTLLEIINYEQARFFSLFPNLKTLVAKNAWLRRNTFLEIVLKPFMDKLEYLDCSHDISFFDAGLTEYDPQLMTENVRVNVLYQVGFFDIQDLSVFEKFENLKTLILNHLPTCITKPRNRLDAILDWNPIPIKFPPSLTYFSIENNRPRAPKFKNSRFDETGEQVKIVPFYSESGKPKTVFYE
jgi:hypothetical protein